MISAEAGSRERRGWRYKPTKSKDMSKKKPAKAKTQPSREPEELTKRPVQAEIPGTERPKIREIDEAAEAYVSVRDTRMSLTEKGVAAKKQLVNLMHAHADDIGRDAEGGLSYRYSDMLVTLRPKEEVLKVKHVSDEDDVSAGSAPKDDSEGD